MTQSIVDYRMSMEHRLEAQLRQVNDLNEHNRIKMQYRDVDLAFTNNIETYAVLRLKRGSFQPVSDDNGTVIILYATHCEVGLGYYDEDKETCFPVDVHEVVSVWINEPAHVQHDMLTRLHDTIDRVIRASRSMIA